MSNGNSRVQPGEVISSSLINQILERLENLEQGGSGTPGTGPIVMTGFDPAFEQEVGQVMAILGSNLPFPPDGSTVLLGSFPVPEANLRISTSNRQRLELVVPSIGSIPAGGESLFVRVARGANSAQLAYRILPSSGVVTPVIDNIHIEGGPPTADLIPMDSVAVVGGSGFSATASENTISFTLLGITPAPAPYPRSGDPPLDVSLTSPTEIRVRVPIMSEVPTVGQTRVRLELQVDGAPAPAVGEFFTIPA